MSDIQLVSWDVDGTLFSYFRISFAVAGLLARSGMKTGCADALQRVHESWRFHQRVERQRRESQSIVMESELEPFNLTFASESRVLEAALRAIRPRSRALA